MATDWRAMEAEGCSGGPALATATGISNSTAVDRTQSLLSMALGCVESLIHDAIRHPELDDHLIVDNDCSHTHDVERSSAAQR